MFRKVFIALGGLIGILVLIMVINALQFESLQIEDVPESTYFDFDEEGAIERFAESLTYETVSHEPGEVNEGAFIQFHNFLEAAFPQTFENLEVETVGDFTLLFTWEGTDEGLDPILLTAHQDVVPIESPDSWSHPPFAGEVVDGIVWGRGAVDNKNGVMGLLEAVETMLRENYQPERTVKLAFGHDEEVGGMYGARKVAELLEERGTEVEFVLDEGGFINDDQLPVDRPVAVVGTAEKGIASFELVVEGRGGHSSMPPRETEIGILASAIRSIEDNPFPASVSGPAQDLFRYVGPEMSFPEQMILGNLWLTEPLVIRMFEGSPATNAMLRTTAAPTMMKGSDKDNVMPSEAKIVVNMRIMPGETVESVEEDLKRKIDDDRVNIRHHREYTFDPSPVSEAGTEQFELLQESIMQIYPDVYVSPFLMVAATDARHYVDLSDHVYRFIPADLNEDEFDGLHAVDEQLRSEVYLRMVRFYQQLIMNAN